MTKRDIVNLFRNQNIFQRTIFQAISDWEKALLELAFLTRLPHILVLKELKD